MALISAAEVTHMLATFGRDDIQLYSGAALVDTFVGIFIAEAQTVDQHNLDMVVLRPMMTLSTTDAAKVTRSHTIKVDGVSYKPYGDPVPNQELGWVQQMLVKA